MTKSILYKVALGLQVTLFAYVFVYGKKGWLVLETVKHEISGVTEQVQKQSQEVAQRTKEIEEWSGDSFYKEKIAREQLQMARTEDEIFYVQQKPM